MFSMQQWLRERTTALGYTYIAYIELPWVGPEFIYLLLSGGFKDREGEVSVKLPVILIVYVYRVT
jgi:hypothetical protein